MKTTDIHNALKSALLAGLLVGLGAVSGYSQFTFDSGSTGADLALNVTTNTTLDLPANGVFNFTTITVASGATLRFTPNTLNTPVYLLATGDVTINGTIDVSGALASSPLGGAAGPGGFAGGNPANGGLPAGDGYGPGAGRAGDAGGAAAFGSPAEPSYGSPGTNHGAVYGSALLIPLVGGSGGSGSGPWGGTGGGGAILIASSTRIDVQGVVSASSAAYFYNGYFNGLGSGGAIRLVAPMVAGTGQLNAAGSMNTTWNQYHSSGGAGRIRIDLMNRRSFALTCVPSIVATIGGYMVAMPTNPPRLDITQVSTNVIPVGMGSPMFFMLPKGADTNQNVTVQASNFGRVVPIRVVLTPDNGPSSSYDSQIDNTAGPASVTVPVVVPVNVQVQINAWTR